MVDYKIYDYTCEKMNLEVAKLYRKVLGVNMENGLGFMFTPNPAGRPIGILAQNQKGDVIGHFATICTKAQVKDETLSGRISMGFMVDSDYRGMHIASNMSAKLFAYLREKNEDDFVIGFPNDNSYNMHVNVMGYKHIRDFHMVTLPKMDTAEECLFSSVSKLKGSSIGTDKNMIVHSESMLNWRFNGMAYMKYRTENGKYFVCNKYEDNIQLLYWSEDVSREECLAFTTFLYGNYNIKEVRTWNFADWLDCYSPQKREFHFCINIINEDKSRQIELVNPWFFYPGDCELF